MTQMYFYTCIISDFGFRFNRDEVTELDFKAYLASSSDDDDDYHDDHPSHNVNMTEEEKIASYRVSTAILAVNGR